MQDEHDMLVEIVRNALHVIRRAMKTTELDGKSDKEKMAKLVGEFKNMIGKLTGKVRDESIYSVSLRDLLGVLLEELVRRTAFGENEIVPDLP